MIAMRVIRTIHFARDGTEMLAGKALDGVILSLQRIWRAGDIAFLANVAMRARSFRTKVLQDDAGRRDSDSRPTRL
jgi:hypothetical protein